MVKSCKLGRNERMSFSKHEEVLDMPDLIEIQKKSFKEFIDKGIREVLEDVSPMVDYSGNIIIEFPADESVIGSFREVKVTESLTWILRGELVNTDE